MPARQMARGPGHPPSLDLIVAYGRDEAPITAEERIIAVLRTGEFIHQACKAARIDPRTYHGWLEAGATANIKKAAGRPLTANETRFARFADRALEAEHEGRMRLYGVVLADATTRTLKTTETVKTNEIGDVVERTTRTEDQPPNWQAAAWILERRYTKDFGRRNAVEITGTEGGPVQIESPLSALLGELDTMERRLGAIDAPSVEVETVSDPPESPDEPLHGHENGSAP